MIVLGKIGNGQYNTLGNPVHGCTRKASAVLETRSAVRWSHKRDQDLSINSEIKKKKVSTTQAPT